MRLIYVVVLAFGWGFIGEAFHWPPFTPFVAIVMTIVFAFYVSRVAEDDRHE